ncbi:type II secretion system GspH family protein [Clostridium swellfunianum]|uniref:type II secretion system protein n=1 Tax=Clostridium swellfunianum TaxID=1367462 RepID=UPI00202F1224|nr:type II secretion system protein [Clostridium swellfunianum]MCM0650388.1 type II secretion system GspH family protein [Clostridium swellfunianum]
MKKGFSLIEVVAVISIILIFLAANFINMSNYIKFYSETDLMYSEDRTIALINYGKQYCREKEKPGYILFDMVRNEINFYSSMRRIDGVKLPKGVTIDFVNIAGSKIDINKYGVTGSAGKVIFKNQIGNQEKITISVGTGYAEIK